MKQYYYKKLITTLFCLFFITAFNALAKHPVSRTHPRLLGSLDRLQMLAQERPSEYQRVKDVARNRQAGDHERMISLSLVCAIEDDQTLGRDAIELAMKYIQGPIRKGHVTFGHDLARCAIVYDLCHKYWTEEKRFAFHDYMNKTVEANVNSETHVFHNGWYGYKWWGIGLACYATYYENERAVAILQDLDREYRERAAPALELAGAGGGWAEGYYIHYFLYEWLFFCEVARYCEGVDYYALAPNFFQQRATASMFEMYPSIQIYNSRRAIPMGDGGGRVFGGDRDKSLSARRILVNYYKDDPIHQSIHAFNETTPRSSVGFYAYKDFLWRDSAVPKGDLSGFKLSHYSPGAGYVYARSSWDDQATYFFFKCGDRFTAHQHLDVGHFLIYKYEELLGDGGHYDSFGSVHDVNYHLRTIAHNTILVHDPSEIWPGIRAGSVTGNDGGQSHSWPHHNGAVVDADAWNRNSELYDIGDIVSMEEHGEYLYIASNCAHAYAAEKLELFTRQILFIRPNTIIIFDRVKSKNAQYKKTFLLQAIKPPAQEDSNWVITNGKGRLFIQTLLPHNAVTTLHKGSDLYRYGGKEYSPSRDSGPAPECRIEISPNQPAQTDYFLHVFTAADSTQQSILKGSMTETDKDVSLLLGGNKITFTKNELGYTMSSNPPSNVEDWPSN